VTRVAVLGAGGRMGVTVCRAVAEAADLELVAAIDPRAAGRSLDEVAALEGTGLNVTDDNAALLSAAAEVAVDFTAASSAVANLAFCAEHKVHAVCGTTGIAPASLEELRRAFGAPGPNCILAPNFSISAVLLLRLAELAAPYFDSAEVIELHHDEKRDAPSGTAIETARRIGAAKAAAQTSFAPDPTRDLVYPGARGGVGPDGVHIHSVRLRGLVAHEEVLFGTLGQSLTIRQDSYDRTSFMPGVLLAIRRVAELEGLTLGLDALLGL
jgi:4-hydroxy-tetrahydrodipicolinate reductase